MERGTVNAVFLQVCPPLVFVIGIGWMVVRVVGYWGRGKAMEIDVVIPFGFACLFWGVVLMFAVITDKDAFAREGKPWWKAAALSVALLLTGTFCFAYRFL